MTRVELPAIRRISPASHEIDKADLLRQHIHRSAKQLAIDFAHDHFAPAKLTPRSLRIDAPHTKAKRFGDQALYFHH